jgi:hypothetical protein
VCIYGECKEQVTQCTQDFNCTMGLQCVDKCEGLLDCANKCVENTKGDKSQALLKQVVSCGQNQKCLSEAEKPEPEPEPGGEEKAKVLECLQEECDSFAECEQSEACMAVVDCFVECNGSFFCGIQCVQAAKEDQELAGQVGLCGQQNSCFN